MDGSLPDSPDFERLSENLRVEFWAQLFDSIDEEDDSVATIRTQLRVELQLNELLTARIPVTKSMRIRISFVDRLHIAYELGLIDRDSRKCLIALAQVRNSFAHPPEKKQAAEKEVQALYQALSPEYRPAAEESGDTLGDKFRYLLKIIVGMFSADIDAVNKGDAPFQMPGWVDHCE
jgi:hypothetical protein